MKIFQYVITLISYILRPEKRKLIRISYSLLNKTGLEIGGPSSFFNLKSYFPVYVFAKRIDGINYSNETVWEGKIEEGLNYKYLGRKKGYQFICEASDLKDIKINNYDFLLSCHSLEHIANPIKTLKNGYDVLKKEGKIILVLPDKDFTFDHKRPYTTFEHLRQDFNTETDENDTTHFEEVIQLHDIAKDSYLNSVDELISRTKDNFSNRCIHHHVYSLELLSELLIYCGFKVTYQQKANPFHLVIIGEK